jgi:PRTRC genetic system protein C
MSQTMEIQTLEREFNYNGVKLPDPNPHMSVEEVKEMYSAQYPELLTAAIEGPEMIDGKMMFKFVRAVGSKG